MMRIISRMVGLGLIGLSILGCKTEKEAGEVHYIDVRTAEEYKAGFIEGAVNIPHGEIAARISEVTEDKTAGIVLYCKSGGRAGVALAALKELGYTNVVNKGGYEGLKAELAAGK